MCETPSSRWAVCGVAAGSPRLSGGWVVDEQELRSPYSWRRALGPGSSHWLFCVCLPLSPICPTRGWALCPPGALPALVPPGPPPWPALICSILGPHAGPYCLGTLSAVLFPAPGTPFLVFSQQTLERGWVRCGGCRALPACTVCLLSLEPLPAPGPVLGSGNFRTLRADAETEMDGEMGAQRRAPSQTVRSGKVSPRSLEKGVGIDQAEKGAPIRGNSLSKGLGVSNSELLH